MSARRTCAARGGGRPARRRSRRPRSPGAAPRCSRSTRRTSARRDGAALPPGGPLVARRLRRAGGSPRLSLSWTSATLRPVARSSSARPCHSTAFSASAISAFSSTAARARAASVSSIPRTSTRALRSSPRLTQQRHRSRYVRHGWTEAAAGPAGYTGSGASATVVISVTPLTGFTVSRVFLATAIASSCGQMP